VHRQGLLLRPDRDLEKADALYLHHRLFVRCPQYCIAQQLPMIGAEDFPIGSIDVPGKENNAALADLPGSHSRNIRFGYAWKYFFHGQVGVGRDECQRRVEAFLARLRRDAMNTIDDAASIFEARQKWMIFSGSTIFFNIEIRVF
jgi:hypothetical protein